MVRVRWVRYPFFSVHLFGLTGGIASGKSAVAARFRKRGVPVIDADLLAREVVAKGTNGFTEVIAAFGNSVVGANGDLDRRALAELVFSDDRARATLNTIVHPKIATATMARASELDARGEPLACYEAALLVENGMADAFRPLVVVSVPLEIQIARAMARDGATEDDVRKRLDAQMPLDAKIRAADFVIDNSGDLETLAKRADRTLAEICAKLGISVERYAL